MKPTRSAKPTHEGGALGIAVGPLQLGQATPGLDLQVAAPHVLEHAGHDLEQELGPVGEGGLGHLLARPFGLAVHHHGHLGRGDPGQGLADDPGHLEGQVGVGEAPVEQRADHGRHVGVGLGVDRLVGLDMGEAQGPPDLGDLLERPARPRSAMSRWLSVRGASSSSRSMASSSSPPTAAARSMSSSGHPARQQRLLHRGLRAAGPKGSRRPRRSRERRPRCRRRMAVRGPGGEEGFALRLGAGPAGVEGGGLEPEGWGGSARAPAPRGGRDGRRASGRRSRTGRRRWARRAARCPGRTTPGP